jgi:imidazolonepropionase-like amidohydrolase
VIGREDRIGSVEPGKVADLVLAGTASPLDDLNTLVGPEQISLVFRDGVPVGGTALTRSITL